MGRLSSQGEGEEEIEPGRGAERGETEGCEGGVSKDEGEKVGEREDRQIGSGKKDREGERRETSAQGAGDSEANGASMFMLLCSSRPGAGAWGEHPLSTLPLPPCPPGSSPGAPPPRPALRPHPCSSWVARGKGCVLRGCPCLAQSMLPVNMCLNSKSAFSSFCVAGCQPPSLDCKFPEVSAKAHSKGSLTVVD